MNSTQIAEAQRLAREWKRIDAARDDEPNTKPEVKPA
jgi:hypothetical protein